jgi:hypothetical protein
MPTQATSSEISSELISLVGPQLTRFKLIYPEFMVYLLSGPRLNGVDSDPRLHRNDRPIFPSFPSDWDCIGPLKTPLCQNVHQFS